ncbi:MAG: SIS domain-containing protein [Clostridiales bacterium]|nr:SIS domain-containing protein [Clostridiales bacterium]
MEKPAGLLDDLLQRYPCLESTREDICLAFRLLCECYENGGKILVCGNGGSAADSEHIVGELMKGFLLKRSLSDASIKLFKDIDNGAYLASRLQGAIPAISLTSQTALISAYSNDVSSDMVYAQQVWGYAKNSPDVLVALSTSGNSANIVNAVKTAAAIGRKSIGITGSNKSKMSELCTASIRMSEDETFKVQELTMPVYHAICAMLEATYF